MKKMIAGFLTTTVLLLSSLTVWAEKVAVPEVGFSAEAEAEMVAILEENDESLGRTVITVKNPKGGAWFLGLLVYTYPISSRLTLVLLMQMK